MMNTDFSNKIPENFAPDSRVWIFQSDRLFTDEEAKEISARLKLFHEHWNAHGVRLHSFAGLLFNRFIVLMADGSVVKICGGSTDDSTRFMRKLEQEFGVSLLDRQSLAFIINGKVEIVPFTDMESRAEEGNITGDTLYFNNTILTKDDLLQKWIVPVKDTWLAKRLPPIAAL